LEFQFAFDVNDIFVDGSITAATIISTFGIANVQLLEPLFS